MTIKLSELVVAGAIVPELKTSERDDAIEELIDALIESGAVSPSLRDGKDGLITMIIDREKKGSTGFGKGVAVPHVKHEKIEGMVAAVGVSQRGVDFNALDKEPVYSIVLLLSSQDKPEEHLQAMENIFSHLQKDKFRRFLRQSTTAEEIKDLIHEADTHQLQG